MVVTCDHCGAHYRFDDGRISGSGARITCPKCRHVFVVHKESSSAEVAEEALDVNTLDFKKVGIQSWKAKVAIGLVYDFGDFKTLRKYIKEGRVTSLDQLSHDGVAWVEIGAIPDLKVHFLEVYRQAERAQSSEIAAEAEAVEAAAHPTQAEAEDIADALLTAVQHHEEDPEVEVEVEVEFKAEAEAEPEEVPPEPEEAPPEPDRSADEIGNDLLAAMDAAVDAEDGGIDLDMDVLLEKNKAEQAVEAEAPKPRRNKEAAALAQVQSTGKAEAQGHQFVDPFEALKQQRQARTKGRSAKSRPRTEAGGEQAGQRRGPKVLLALVLVCGCGYLAFDYFASQPAPADPSLAAEAETLAQSAREEKRAASARQKMQAKLNAELSAVQEDDIEAFNVVDEQLIPVGGPSGGVPVRPGLVRPDTRSAPGKAASGSRVDQRDTTSSDHAAMGKAAAGQGRWPQAVKAYGKALKMDSGNAKLRAELGMALYRAGRSDEAEGELRQAAAAGAVSAYKSLGRLAEEQGDTSGAVAHYQTYLRSGPRDRAAIEKRIQQLTN